MAADRAPPLLLDWEDTVVWLLERTEQFPARLRYSLARRIDDLALEVLEALVVARFARDPRPALRQVSVALDRLRLILRVAWRRRALSEGQYAHAAERVDRAGRMTGGWLAAPARGPVAGDAP